MSPGKARQYTFEERADILLEMLKQGKRVNRWELPGAVHAAKILRERGWNVLGLNGGFWLREEDRNDPDK